VLVDRRSRGIYVLVDRRRSRGIYVLVDRRRSRGLYVPVDRRSRGIHVPVDRRRVRPTKKTKRKQCGMLVECMNTAFDEK
jgi:hypothetical protein